MIRPDTKTAAPRMPSDDGTEDLDGLVDLDDLEDLDDLDGLDSFDDLEGLEEPESRAGEREEQTATTGSPRHVATTLRRHEEGADSALEASVDLGKARPKTASRGGQAATGQEEGATETAFGEKAQVPAKRGRGRPPSHPRLILKDEGTMTLLAERVLNLTTNLVVLDELDCTEQELIAFMKRRGTKAAIQRKLAELQQSGEVARRRANASLHHGVSRMTEIIRDPEVGPNAAIGATSTLSKIASVNGKQQQAREDRGPAFSLVINIPGANGGNEAMRIETNDVIEGELSDG